MYDQQTSSLTLGIFLLLLLSLLSNFHAWPSSRALIYLFLFKIWFIFFWLLLVLFKLFYKISFFFHFHHPSIFSYIRFAPYFFYCYLFYLRQFLKLKFFFMISSPYNYLFLSDLIIIFLLPFLFHFGNFFKLIFFFLISSFNINFVWNWTFWFSLEFHELRVWKINPSLWDSSKFTMKIFKINFFYFIIQY
jgi:hypothetical protein